VRGEAGEGGGEAQVRVQALLGGHVIRGVRAAVRGGTLPGLRGQEAAGHLVGRLQGGPHLCVVGAVGP